MELLKCFFEEERFAEAQNLLSKCPHNVHEHRESEFFGFGTAKSTA